MPNLKWTSKDNNTCTRHVVVLMISRNKDNKDVEDFVERRESYFTKWNFYKIYNKFSHFVEDGVEDEFCRLYISINSRDPEKVNKKLLHKLIDKDIDLTYIQSEIAGLAAQHDCAIEKQWFFDFDNKDINLAKEFISDINKIDNSVSSITIETPNGYAITASHGFDSRELLNKWKNIVDVELKRDDLICFSWKVNNKDSVIND